MGSSIRPGPVSCWAPLPRIGDQELSAADVGRVLSISPAELDRLLEEGVLRPRLTLGGLEVFFRSDIEALRAGDPRR